jgi:hypothetical protein
VKATDASNGTVTNVAPSVSPPTTYTLPVHDRPSGGHNSPIKVYNITISSSVATDIKIETFYDGSAAGHTHGGRPLKDDDLTQANQLGALFGGANRSGGLVGTVMTFRLGAGATRTISYQTTGFAGLETVRFTYNNSLPGFRASNDWRISANVNYLQALEYGPYWINYGETPKHPNNHYGTTAFNNFLRDFGYYYWGWTGGGSSGNPEKFRYNDMSLATGGPFDIDGMWNNRQEHQEHRDGMSVDLSHSACKPWVSDFACQTGDPNALKPVDQWVAWNAWLQAESLHPELSNLRFWDEPDLNHWHFQADL